MTPTIAASAPDLVVFGVAAAIILGGAFGVIICRNPVRSALSLVATLIGVGVLFVAQEAHFLFAVQIIVYAGAIVVLFLFVIMLLGVDKVNSIRRDPLPGQRPLAIVFSLAMGALIVALARWSWEATGAPSQGGTASGPGTNIEKLSDSIFTQYFFAFEATSLLLVIAVVGAVYLARRPSSPTSHIAIDAIADTEPAEDSSAEVGVVASSEHEGIAPK